MKIPESETPPVLARDRARTLRAAQTEVERRLWQRLRNRQLNGAKFRRQHPIGSYIADFFCLDARLVIELDGRQHGENERWLLTEPYYWPTCAACSGKSNVIFRNNATIPRWMRASTPSTTTPKRISAPRKASRRGAANTHLVAAQSVDEIEL
jgi:hypothetical protein